MSLQVKQYIIVYNYIYNITYYVLYYITIILLHTCPQTNIDVVFPTTKRRSFSEGFPMAWVWVLALNSIDNQKKGSENT